MAEVIPTYGNGPYQDVRYFPGLAGLRGIAALLVFVHHSESSRQKQGLFNLYDHTAFRNGGTAVSFFFVLSGFLITYLLLRERGLTGKIDVKAFYLRRFLRIWPLYFLIVSIGLAAPSLLELVGKHQDVPFTAGEVWAWYLFFMPFVVNIQFGHAGVLSPLWSIGVEEIFYLAWAPLMLLAGRHLLCLLWAVLVIKVLLTAYADVTDSTTLLAYCQALQFEAMAIGGLGAYYLFGKRDPITHNGLFATWRICLVVALLFYRLVLYSEIPAQLKRYLLGGTFDNAVTGPLFLDLLFLYLIVASSQKLVRWLTWEGKVSRWLGDISYGIYMYHMLIVTAVLMLAKPVLQILPAPGIMLLNYAIAAPLLLLTAHLSRRYFEEWFLRLKPKQIGNAGTQKA